jgi:hypothetical protein
MVELMFPAVMLLTSIFDTHPVIEAGMEYNLPKHAISNNCLRMLAEKHARSMATRRHQDHKDWDNGRQMGRFWDIQIEMPGVEAREICAESWPGDSVKEAAAGCWDEWKTSPGHWSVANGKPDLYGVGMARSRKGIYYICIIAVWERP